jgi:hypothetical protein
VCIRWDPDKWMVRHEKDSNTRPAKKLCMNAHVSVGYVILTLSLLSLLVLPAVSAVTIGSNAAETILSTPVTTAATNASISATISAKNLTVGDRVTIAGSETGVNTTAGVEIWVFSGNYVLVETVPVKADGSFSKTYDTATYPASQYYVFVQSPGPDGKFNIGLDQSGVYSGQVVNTVTGALLINFTGEGSVHDRVAADDLSDALSEQGTDDVYTKLTFQLAPQSAPYTTPAEPAPVAPSATTIPVTKSSLPPWVGIGALVGGSFLAAFLSRRT